MTIQRFLSFSDLQGYLTNKALFTRLVQIRDYSSKFEFIDRAIEQIPEGIFHPKSVLKIFHNTIAIYEKAINPFPAISHLQELKDLERKLEDDSLKELWDTLWRDALSTFADKPKLENIEQIRMWFENEQNQSLLDQVITLSLRNRNIIQLPREIFRLRNLEELDLYGNLIETLADSIKVWKRLKKLELSHNELTYLPHNGIKHLKNLQYLHTRGNWLNTLPRSIGRLKKLKKLNIRENYLSKLSKEIGKCTALRSLDISSNMLLELPVEIQNLTNLKKFSCADNDIKILPRGLEKWKQIQKVDLSCNLFSSNTKEFLQKLWPNATKVSLEE